MSVRVVARIRPLLKNELDRDVIVSASNGDQDPNTSTVVRIPNPKNENEQFSFQFNRVYEQESSQQELFEHEGSARRQHFQLTTG